MKTAKMFTILFVAFGLIISQTPVVHGTQYITVDGQDVTSITLELGQSRTVEIVSTDSTSYVDYAGFDNGLVFGTFSHLETKPEAGNLANVIEYNQPTFYGYYVNATGISPPPSVGVHFVFEYTAQQVGETDLKLYDSTLTSVIDAVHVTVIPLQSEAMGTAFTYQGRLMDSNSPADGVYDLLFKLFNEPNGNNSQISITNEINDIDVIDGYFTVEPDFGSDIFHGDSRWLEISARPGYSNDVNDYVTLSPRQEVTPTPYALQTRGLFVDNSYNIGMGTTSPKGKLHVDGGKAADDTDASDITIKAQEGGDAVRGFTGRRGGDIILLPGEGGTSPSPTPPGPSGNIGIGAKFPEKRLTVAGGDFVVYPGCEGSEPAIITDGYNVKLGDSDGIGNQVFLEVDDSSNKFIFHNGNVGIGTTVANNKLTVITSESGGKAIFGEAAGDDGTGVHGQGEDRGVYGLGWGSTGRGVYGLATDPSGVNYGVYGETWSSNGYAGYFQGRVRVTGNLSKGGGSFKIDHPLDPENKYLQHSFVESPDMMNVYNGNVTLDKNGETVVKLPGYFEALNQDFRYQLTCIGGFAPVYVAEEISEDQFKIAGGKRGMKVSWQITGIRHDAYAKANRIMVEEDKAVETRGYYLHPEVYGYGKEKSIDALCNAQVSEIRKVAINTD